MLMTGCASPSRSQPLNNSQNFVQPQGAASFILSAFKDYPIVALGRVEGAGNRNQLTLFTDLLDSAEFASTVGDIVIECGNSLYQPLLDRYVAGENVSLHQLEVVWQKTTQFIGCEADPTTKDLLLAVRAANKRYLKAQRLRVLAADPAMDWAKVHTPKQLSDFLDERNASAAKVIETEVLAKHAKALVIIGGGHLMKRTGRANDVTITMLVSQKYPRATYVIIPLTDFDKMSRTLRSKLDKWPVPSIAAIRGTGLGAMNARIITSSDTMMRIGSRWVPVDNAYPGLKLEDLFDAALFLGPAKALQTVDLQEPTDPAYIHELNRLRHLLMSL